MGVLAGRRRPGRGYHRGVDRDRQLEPYLGPPAPALGSGAHHHPAPLRPVAVRRRLVHRAVERRYGQGPGHRRPRTFPPRPQRTIGPAAGRPPPPARPLGQRVLRPAARPGPRSRSPLAVLAAPGPLRPGAQRPGHRDGRQPAHPALPGGPAPAAPPRRDRRHRRRGRPERLLQGGTGHRPAGRHAIPPCGLGPHRRRGGHLGVGPALPVARAPLPRRHHGDRGRHR